MALSPSITESMILTALRAFFLSVLPVGVEVVQGQTNRVAQPMAPDFIVMTPTARMRLATNVDTWNETIPNPVTIEVDTSTQVTVQLDVHGPNSADHCQMISQVFRDYYGVDHIDTGMIVPLYAGDAAQAPFINGESQYENRWVLPVVFQVNPVVSTPQDFASIVNATVIPILEQ
jgi:hypothetical protein